MDKSARDLTNENMPKSYLGMCHQPGPELKPRWWPDGQTRFDSSVVDGIGYDGNIFLPQMFSDMVEVSDGGVL